MPELFEIKDVEIFAEGTWNGTEYTDKDINELIQSFQEIGDKMKPYLKLGHTKKQALVQSDGMPALGWITNLKNAGKKLMADFRNVPKKIYELISSGAYRRVSSEFFLDYEIGGKIYPKVLKAVALLGGDTPAVKTLDDIINLGFAENQVILKDDMEYEVQIINEEDTNMTEEALKVLKEQNDKLVAEGKVQSKEFSDKEKTFTEQIAGKDAEIKKLKEENEVHLSEIAKVKEEKEDALLAKQVEEFVEKKKIVPAQKENVIKLIKNAKTDEDKKAIVAFIEAQVVSLNTDGNTNISNPESDKDSAGDEFTGIETDKKVKKYMEEHKGVSYGDAFRTVTFKAMEDKASK